MSRSVAYLRSSGQTEDLDFILTHQDDVPDVFVMRGAEVVGASAGVALPA